MKIRSYRSMERQYGDWVRKLKVIMRRTPLWPAGQDGSRGYGSRLRAPGSERVKLLDGSWHTAHPRELEVMCEWHKEHLDQRSEVKFRGVDGEAAHPGEGRG